MLKKILLVMLLIFTEILIGNDKGEKEEMLILEDKPVFTIRMETEYSNFIVTLNGIKVFKDLGGSPTILEVPVNHLMTSGKNELKVQLMAWDDSKFQLHKKLLCKVSLRVKRYEDFENEPKVISKIIYDNSKEKPLENSTKQGRYDSENNFVLNKNGDVMISDIKQKKLTFYQGGKIGGVMLSQFINLETPFPKWKFLDSEKIIEGRYDELTNNEYDILRQRIDIKNLFATYKKIYDALEKKDVDSIINLFDERNKEMDIAMYRIEEPYYKNRLYEKLKIDAHDSSRELSKWDESEMYFFIEENSRLIYIDGAIAFNDKDGSTHTRYPISFRKEKDKWIVTR